MKPRFLLDENLDPDIAHEARRRDPSIDIVYVGVRGAPTPGTLDPAILDFCEAERRILITNNRASMPGHVADHLAAGRHSWGVLTTRARKPPIGQLVEEILTIADASEAEEWYDLSDWIP
jgi:hypothetical protein